MSPTRCIVGRSDTAVCMDAPDDMGAPRTLTLSASHLTVDSSTTDLPVSSRAISLSLNILHLIGLWPLKRSVAYSLYTSLMSLNYCTFLLMMVLTFFAKGKSATAYLEDFGISLAFIPVTVSIAMVLFKRSQFDDLISNLRAFYSLTSGPDSDQSLREAIAEEKNLFVIVPVACVFGLVAKLAQPLLTFYTKHQETNTTTVVIYLPIQVHPFENETTSSAYTAMYALQCVVYTLMVVTFVPVDIFLSVLVLYTAKQFEMFIILIRRVDGNINSKFMESSDGDPLCGSRAINTPIHVRKDGKPEFECANPRSGNGMPFARTQKESNSGRWKETTDVWRNLAACHQKALRNATNLCEFLRTLLFVHYAVTSLVICLILYQLSAVDDILLLVYNCNYLAAVLIRLFILSFFSTRLTSKSVEVSDTIAGTQCHNYDQRVKTTLVVIMCRAQRPVQLWAGRFAIMSLETYAAILHAAYSYFNILLRVT